MPLIHDNPWLIEQLLKSVAQDAAPPVDQNVQNQRAADALRALLGNLRNQMTPGQSGIQHGVGNTSVSLGSQHMESMGDFVEWLVANQTKMGGAQIVYPGTSARPSEDYGYYKIEPGTKIVVESAPPNPVRPTVSNRTEVGYWIDPESLKNYLVSLQADTKLKNNVTFQVQLLNLIRFANEQLDIGMSEQHKEELPNETPVDAIPNPIDPNNWGSQGTVPLTYSDVKSPESLGGWVSSKKIGVQKDGKIYYSNDLQNFKLCDVIVVLVNRANSMTETTENKKIIDAYRASAMAIAKQHNCDLSGSSESSQQQSGKGQGSSGKAGDIQDLADMATLQPFDANYIDFRQILAFVDRYAAWARRPEVTQLKDQIHTSIRLADAYLNAPDTPIQISNNTVQKFQLLTKNANQAKLLANYLYTIISYTGRMYQDFTTVFERGYGAQAARSIKQQIAPGGPQQSNIDDLAQMMRLL